MINIDTHGDTFDNNNNNKNQQDLYPPSHLSSYTTTTFINNRTNQSRTSNSIDTDIDLDIDCLVNMKDKPDVAGAMAEERKGDGSKSSSLVEKDKDKDKDKDNTKSLDDSNNNNNGQDIDDIKIHSYILHIPQLKSWYNKIINICSSSRTKPIVAVVLYGTVSLCQTIFNKKVMSTFRFDAPNIMLFCQMLLSLFVLQTLKYTNTIKLDTTLNINIIKKLMPLSICYVLNCIKEIGGSGDTADGIFYTW
ncbi:hypothetical protein DFA_05038 [Cavenderia fasciculata]|uniref:Uncharacterized protein n=1 Tax=Cavenderia fasciculata TaxID=261658 RepID=F4PN15_CACFS|nr:uncharacterized protein DFA_05038 [Cavenderia fasciculata]EGG22908.1 hypothetical protein DFA_05038 [Cavenderia fasciculata]|eukprot:XP_004360759.1 hypothetical protein DFA_05038 [Cavenderia fasciculata]